ncbi:MAG: hypothetical protein WC827_03620 [Candidatus Paceibacterota bacterium]|jgi:hypothetical protein
MNLEQLYQDFSIDYRTEGHKHTRPGWINCECPWCTGNPGFHLGFNISSEHFVCWRCGAKYTIPTIAKLLKVREQEAYKVIKRYGLLISPPRKESPSERLQFTLPSGVEAMKGNHRKYLEGRNFDPDYLEHEWGLLGTGPVSLLDKIDYRFRIVIPFKWDGVQVSFDSRDITGKHPSKYMACPKNRELIPHKEILYGKQSEWKSTGIIVEGPSDVWRFGPKSAATSGIKYTPKQVRLIARTFKRAAICFDGGESQAIIQANALVGDLRFRGCDAFRVDIEGDPGSMNQEEANYLVKQLLK